MAIGLGLQSFPLFLLFWIITAQFLHSSFSAHNFGFHLKSPEAKLGFMHRENAMSTAVDHRKGHRRLAILLEKHNLQNSTPFAGRPEGLAADLQIVQGEYLVTVSIGTPTISYSALVDTGSGLVWTPCRSASNPQSQAAPMAGYDPHKSSSFTKVSCSDPRCSPNYGSFSCIPDEGSCIYQESYADNSSSTGFLAYETFALGVAGNWTSKNVTFGCGSADGGFAGSSGVIGLNRGPMSLISQLGELVDHRFSYCLAFFNSSSGGRLSFGAAASIGNDSTAAVRTPLLVNPNQPYGYFLSLNGISVGGKRLAVPVSAFQFDQHGSGGVGLDSGSLLTYLIPDAYRQVREAFIEAIQRPTVDTSAGAPVDLCFRGLPDSMSIPEPLTLHLDGGDLNLGQDNYVFGLEQGGGLTCLAMSPSPFGMSLLGNAIQQNMHVLYDLKSHTVTFTPAQCDHL